MASRQAIAAGLATLLECFPSRDITPRTADVWSASFEDVDDAAWLGACATITREPGRRFFPTTGEVRAVLTPLLPAVNVEDVLRKISALGTYSPVVGWIGPRIDAVRNALGDAIADAYGMVGGGRCFSDNQTTREIARRDFAQAIESERTPLARLYGSGRERPQLESGE